MVSTIFYYAYSTIIWATDSREPVSFARSIRERKRAVYLHVPHSTDYKDTP